MKTLLTLVLICLLICTSCQNENQLPEVAVISGTIINHKDKDLNISDFLGKSEWKEYLIVADSTFEAQYNLEKPMIKMLVYDRLRKDIYLEPNKTLNIYFDAENADESFKYKGDLAIENSILDSVSSDLKRMDYRYVYGLELDTAASYLDSLNSVYKNQLESLINANETSSDFIEYTHAFIDYNIAGLKIRLGGRKATQPDNYYVFLDELTLTDPKLLDIPEYRMFLYSYINWESNLRLKQLDSIESNTADAKFMEELEVIKQLENDEIREYSLYNAMLMKLRESSVEDFEKHYDYFKMNGTDYYANQLEKAVNKKKMIAAGKTAPGFTLRDINGEEKSLADFKGQYVLIDFWNSRCGRCRRDLPYFMELQSDYTNENIAFVSISNDPDQNDWKTYVKEKKDVGTSLWTEKFWESKTFKDYQIKGTPTYVLIDTEGKIINPMSPKPSSPELKKLLNNTLEIQ